MTTIYIDIETLPGMRPGARDAFIEASRANFKAPSSLTKEQAAIDLGMTDASEIKFTSKDKMLALWADRFAAEKADEVGDAEWRKTSFDGSRGMICVVGVALDDLDPVALWSNDYANNEASILRALFRMLSDAREEAHMRRPLFVGHNLTGFDLRFVYQRAVINRVPVPIWWPTNARPWDDSVFDTMTQWAGHGSRISLDNLCSALGLEGKAGMDGSMVCDEVRIGRIAKVADYCMNDVAITRDCYRRMTFQGGIMSIDNTTQIAAAPTQPDTGKTVTLGQINAVLSPISITAAGLASIGFESVGRERAAVLYRESDVSRICAALVRHLQSVGQVRQAA